MAERALLDTNVAIYLAQGNEFGARYREALRSKVCVLSIFTVAELWMAAERAKDNEAARRYWQDRLGLYEILYPDLETAELWARIGIAQRKIGQPRQDNDLWSAATAIRHRTLLASHNKKHFAGIEGLELLCCD